MRWPKSQNSMICILEKKQDIESILKASASLPRDTKFVGCTPEVLYCAQKHNFSIMDIEQFCCWKSLNKIGDENYGVVNKVCDELDYTLKSLLPDNVLLKHISFHNCFNDIKGFLDGFCVRFHQLQGLLGVYDDSKILYFPTAQNDIHGSSLFSKSAYYFISKILPILAKIHDKKCFELVDGSITKIQCEMAVIDEVECGAQGYASSEIRTQATAALHYTSRNYKPDSILSSIQEETIVVQSTNLDSILDELELRQKDGIATLGLGNLIKPHDDLNSRWLEYTDKIIDALQGRIEKNSVVRKSFQIESTDCWPIFENFVGLVCRQNVKKMLRLAPLLHLNLNYLSEAKKKISVILGGLTDMSKICVGICRDLKIKTTSVHYGVGSGFLKFPMYERYDLGGADFFICGGSSAKQILEDPCLEAKMKSYEVRAKPVALGLPWTDDLIIRSQDKLCEKGSRNSTKAKNILVIASEFYGDNRYLGYLFPAENALYRANIELFDKLGSLTDYHFKNKPTLKSRILGLNNPLPEYLKDRNFPNITLVEEDVDVKKIIVNYDALIMMMPGTPMQFALAAQVPTLIYSDKHYYKMPTSVPKELNGLIQIHSEKEQFFNAIPEFCKKSSNKQIDQNWIAKMQNQFVSGEGKGKSSSRIVDFILSSATKKDHSPSKKIENVRYNFRARKVADSLKKEVDPEIDYYPTQLALEPFRGCNAKCVMCPTGAMDRRKGALTVENAKIICEKIAEWGAPINRISHAGLGEPLINKNLEEIIKLEKKIFPKASVVIYTNGGLLSEERALCLMDSGLDIISFSINGHDPQNYEKVMKISYEKTLENVLRIRELIVKHNSHMQIHVSMVKTAYHDKDEMTQFREYWEDKVDSVVFPPYITWGGDFGYVGSKKQLSCFYIWKVLMVDNDGTVKMCCEDYDSKHPTGNLLEQSPQEIFNGKFMRFVRKRQINEQFSAPKMCENCVESWDTSLDFWKKPDLVKK